MASAYGLDLLQEIAGRLSGLGQVEHTTMFNRPGLRTAAKVVLFLGTDDRLMLKLPLDRVTELVEQGAVERVTIGTRTLREWVEVPAIEGDEVAHRLCLTLASEAFIYVRSLVDEV